MYIIEIKNIEDCFDGSNIREVLLTFEVTKALIFALGEEGKLQYFGDFARPFFKIRVEDKYDLKGIEGNNTIRVHLKNPGDYSIDDFCDFLEDKYLFASGQNSTCTNQEE